MATFDERQKGFESKFKHDQEFAFKVTARRNRLLGLWAAGKLGLGEADAEAYAKEVIAADFDRPGDTDVIEKVAGDLKRKGVAIDEAQVKAELQRCAAEAKKQLSQS